MAGIGSTPSLVVGIAAGAAASAALEPALEIPKQNAWQSAPNRVLEPELLARLVAQGGVDLGTAHTLALKSGHSNANLDALAYLSQTVPGFAEAMHLWRLGFINSDLMTHALIKAGLDERYVQPILNTKIEELIGLGDIAYAVVRGILPAPAYVPVAPPAHGDKVPRFPQVNIDPEALAAKIGYSPEALQVMVGRSGLSMAPGMAAQAEFRKIIGPNDFLMAIAEGDLRTEWADAVREVSREILTAGQYAELQLRGFLDAPTRRSLTAQHGMSDADSDLLYDVQGRAPSIRQTFIGMQRGATYDGTAQTIPSPYLEAAQRSNLRPEWFSVAYENRYSLPSAFVVRALLTDGAIDETRGQTILEHSGWPSDLAQLVAAHYAAKAGAGTSSDVGKAQTHLWTTTHTAYKNGEIDAAEVTKNLATLGIPAADQTQIMSLWNAERDTFRKQLTPTQIKKAYKGAVTNPATGVAWTLDDALAALIARGYSPNDAHTFLSL